VLCGIFLVVFIASLYFYYQQPARQAELEEELLSLQGIIEKPSTQKEVLEAELNKIEAELEAAKESFPQLEQSVYLVDVLYELAESNDIVITKAVTTLPDLIEEPSRFPPLTFEISVTGQVPKFQNFILALGERFPTSQLTGYQIAIAEEEGEEDSAILTIVVSCYQGAK
jgi:hypothetical protein